MALVSCSGREQRRIVLSSIQGLLSRARVPGADNGLAVLGIKECGLPDRPTWMELYWVLTTDQAEVDSRIGKVHLLEVLVPVAEEGLEGFRVAHAHGDELMAERAS